jgi:hypothetical protein
VRYRRWGTLRTDNIRRLSFKEVKLIIKKYEK